MFHYFVSYIFSKSSFGDASFGNCTIERNKPITKFSDIRKIEQELEKSTTYCRNFVVLNYQLLREEPDTE